MPTKQERLAEAKEKHGLNDRVIPAVQAGDEIRAEGFSDLEGPLTELVLAATLAARSVKDFLGPEDKAGKVSIDELELRLADFLVNDVLRRVNALEDLWRSYQAKSCDAEEAALNAEIEARMGIST